MNYRGKVAVVTGASSGIGYHAALALAERGCTVVGVARRQAELEELTSRCRRHASDSTFMAGDLGERAFAEHVVNDSARRFGRLDILVNNAGIPMHKQIYDVTPDDVELVMRVNFMSSVWTTLAAIPHMLLLGEAWIINVSSFAAQVAPPRETAYTASKAAMDGFTEGLWTDLAGSGIHAGLVIPGPIDTEIWDKDDSPSGYSGSRHPPAIVVDAILECMDNKLREVVAPRYSPQLLAARWMRFLTPSLMLKGMDWMEPVPEDVVVRARAEARRKRDGEGGGMG
jgi:short-subunit dehydrogenase